MSNYSKWSPIAKLKEKNQWPPYPKGSSKYYDYLDEIRSYCKDGYPVGGERITGPHFFSLNLCYMGIKDKKRNNAKVPTLPYFSDWQKEAYDTFEDICETGENLIGLKGRDKGWTYFVAHLALYYTQILEHTSTLALFPGGTSIAKATFREHYDMAYNELLFDLKFPDLKSTEGKYVEEIKYGMEIKEIDPVTGKETKIKKTVGPQTKLINMILTTPDVVRSGRNQLAFIEEFGEVSRGIDTIGVLAANMKEGNDKLGPIIVGGTSNQFGSGFTDFKKLWLNPEDHKFRKIWIPGNKFFLPFVNLQTGESDLESAKEAILKERGSKTGRDLIVAKQEFPLTEDEALYEGINSEYDVEKCNTQIARVLSDKSISNAIQRGNLYPKKDGKGNIIPVFELCDNGKFEIFKHPDPSLKYPIVGGLDSYRMGKVTDSPSKGAIEFYVPFQGMNVPGSYPACVYWERPEDKDVFFMDALLATIYYDTKILVELTDEDIISFFKTHNALNRLKERPSIIKSAYSKAENKYGILPTVHNMAMALEYSIKEFNHNYDQIVFVELLREMIRFAPDVNTDRAWAHHWAVLHSMDNMKVLEEYKKPVREKRFTPSTYIDQSGQLVVVKTVEEAVKRGIIQPELTEKEKAMFGKSR